MVNERNTRIRASQIASIYPSDVESTNALGSAMDGYVPVYDITTGKFTWVEASSGDVTQSDLNKVKDNIVLNAFRIAINGSLSQFNMVDGIVDEYEDESGIDTDNSVNQAYNSSDGYYQNSSTSGGIDSNTKLMMHFNGIDTSISIPLTLNSGAQISTSQYKFGSSSLYLDGSNDYISIASYSYLRPNTGDFTIECWVRPSDVSNVRRIISTTTGGTTSTDIIFKQEGAKFRVYFGSTALLSSSDVLTVNTWTHLACVRSGTNVYLFADGVQVASDTNSDDITNSFRYIGGYYNTSEYFQGYIDEIRISKGYARYTSGFTPSTSAYVSDQYTSLLCHFNGSNGATSTGDSSGGDETNNDHICTFVGTAQLDTAQSKFGNCSLLLDGNSDYVSIADSDDFNFGDGDFTIDFWAYMNANSNRVISQGNPWSTNNSWAIYCNGTGKLGILIKDNSTGLVSEFNSSAGWSTGSWVHIAIVRNGTDWRGYVNGVSKINTTSSLTFPNTSAPVFIGREDIWYFNGWIDEFRVSKGIARWTSNFTPPTFAYSTSPIGYNMELLSDSFTAENQPDSGRLVVLEEDIDTITINTDLKAWGSRDGGSTWIQGTLTDEGDYDSSKRILTADFDFTASGVDTGTSMKYKLTSHNTKDLKIHGSGLSWD